MRSRILKNNVKNVLLLKIEKNVSDMRIQNYGSRETIET